MQQLTLIVSFIGTHVPIAEHIFVCEVTAVSRYCPVVELIGGDVDELFAGLDEADGLLTPRRIPTMAPAAPSITQTATIDTT